MSLNVTGMGILGDHDHTSPFEPSGLWGLWDIDGTLSDESWRAQFALSKDWDGFHSRAYRDPPRFAEIELLNCWIGAGHRVAFITGRPEQYREMTNEWLDKYTEADEDDELHMRPHKDFRSSAELKIEVLEKHFLQKRRQVAFMFDDNPRVIEAFRERRIVCFQSLSATSMIRGIV